MCRGAREGLDLLCRAYGADAGHPGVLALLAQCSLARGDTARASTLAAAAAEAADADDARAEALSLQARLPMQEPCKHMRLHPRAGACMG